LRGGLKVWPDWKTEEAAGPEDLMCLWSVRAFA